jgi:hypothetical protein
VQKVNYLRTAFSAVWATDEFDMATAMLVATSIPTLECLKMKKLNGEKVNNRLQNLERFRFRSNHCGQNSEVVRRQSVAQGLGFCEYEFWWLTANIYDRNSLDYLYYVPKCLRFLSFALVFFLTPQCHFLLFNNVIIVFNFVLFFLFILPPV